VLDRYPGKVRLVFKNFPLRNHRFARPAAMAALAAGQQGRFWEYHDKLFENYNKINEGMLVTTARELNLDMNRFERDRKDIRINNLINRDIAEGGRIGVRGTPTVFVNGLRFSQNRSLDTFSAVVEKELAVSRQLQNR
jgi:protein-disulfide isomerase